MKATLEIPDALYRKVKAKSALDGRPVREVATELFAAWVGEPVPVAPPPAAAPKKLPPWFGVAHAYAAKVARHDMASVRESIARGRS